MDAVAAGRHVLLEIDLQGARQVRAAMPEARFVFLAPPSWDDLVARLEARLLADDAVAAADWVLFANPNQLGVEYNAKIFAGWAEVWRLLGWDA